MERFAKTQNDIMIDINLIMILLVVWGIAMLIALFLAERVRKKALLEKDASSQKSEVKE